MAINVHNAHLLVKSKRTDDLVQNALMTDDRPEAAKRLQQAREHKGFGSAKAAADFFGWNYDSYIQHERGERGLSRAAQRYALAFNVSAGWLLTGEGEGPRGKPRIKISHIMPIEEFERQTEVLLRGEEPPNQPAATYTPEPNAIIEGQAALPWVPPVRDVEELGVGIASIDDDESAFELNGQVVDRVIRPPGLVNRPGVFALRVANLSMWPKFRDGERVYVDKKNPAIEDFIVVELKPVSEDRPGKAYVKMLVARDAQKIVVEQFNPRGRLEFGRNEIKQIFRVIPTEELWG